MAPSGLQSVRAHVRARCLKMSKEGYRVLEMSHRWLLWRQLAGGCLGLDSGPWQDQHLVLVTEPFVQLLK